MKGQRLLSRANRQLHKAERAEPIGLIYLWFPALPRTGDNICIRIPHQLSIFLIKPICLFIALISWNAVALSLQQFRLCAPASGYAQMEKSGHFLPGVQHYYSLTARRQRDGPLLFDQRFPDIQTLTITSVDAISNYTFLPLFRHHIETYPDICLFINTHHSNEIHSLVESRAADIGFVFSRTNYPDIISKPVYRELMYLICHKDSPYHNDMPCSDLRPEDEIYLRWGLDFQEWHNLHWSPDRYSLLTVNTGSMLQHYLTKPGRWAVAPMSVVHSISHNTDLTYYTFQEPPTPCICYMLTNRYPNARRRESIQIFEQELLAFIEKSRDICSFEAWMLKD